MCSRPLPKTSRQACFFQPSRRRAVTRWPREKVRDYIPRVGHNEQEPHMGGMNKSPSDRRVQIAGAQTASGSLDVERCSGKRRGTEGVGKAIQMRVERRSEWVFERATHCNRNLLNRARRGTPQVSGPAPIVRVCCGRAVKRFNVRCAQVSGRLSTAFLTSFESFHIGVRSSRNRCGKSTVALASDTGRQLFAIFPTPMSGAHRR